MSADNHLGHAYPFITGSTLADSAIADIDITILRGEFDPTTDTVRVVAVRLDSILFQFSASNGSISVPISPGQWTELVTDDFVIRVLAGLEDSLAQGWSGSAVVEPCRVAVIAGSSQSIEVYSRARTRTNGKPGCIPLDFGLDEFVDQYGLVYQCGPLTGDVQLAGGYSSVVTQYGSTGEIIVRADASGGELGRPCDSQFPIHDEEIIPVGATTFDGSPRCSDVLRSVNGVVADNINVIAGTGVSVYPQPDKSRLTIRFDGAGSARCPEVDIQQALCPPTYPGYCGPTEDTDICPDAPSELASLRDPNQIPPLEQLPILKPGTCLPVPSKYKHLTLRNCSSAVIAFVNGRWRFTQRCLPHCYAELPTQPGRESDVTRLDCHSVGPDTTIGVRNNDFGDDLANWGYDTVPFQVVEFPGLDVDALPAIGLSGTQYIYQTEIFVPHRSTLKFGYLGKLTVSVVSLGRLCVDEELDSEGVYAVYTGKFLIPARQPVSIQFSVANALDTVVVSLPYLVQS